ncbi:MAG: hypothetical protein H5U40_11350, partial [Polyangiaceae bacterium]|nr:hypothetical protein [Polyangiaceae bacterium]
SPNPSGLLIYLEGGGACWDYEACGTVGDYGLSFHLDGFDQSDWDGEWGSIYKAIVPFDRERAENPWRDAHHVFMPYCTADVFAGDRVTELFSNNGSKSRTMHYRGHHNFAEYLKRLVPTFHDTPRVWLTGSSAGAFGAQLNWFQASERFGDVRVDVISDSGQPVMPDPETWQTWLDTWGLVLPEGCTNCEDNISNILRYGAETILADGARYGLIAYDKDIIISGFIGISISEHEAGVHEVLDRLDDPSYPNSDRADYFAKDGYFHTTFLSGITTVDSEGVLLWEWLTQFVNDDPELRSLGPD